MRCITLNQTLTATVPGEDETWCHHPSGMKTASARAHVQHARDSQSEASPRGEEKESQII